MRWLVDGSDGWLVGGWMGVLVGERAVWLMGGLVVGWCLGQQLTSELMGTFIGNGENVCFPSTLLRKSSCFTVTKRKKKYKNTHKHNPVKYWWFIFISINEYKNITLERKSHISVFHNEIINNFNPTIVIEEYTGTVKEDATEKHKIMNK